MRCNIGATIANFPFSNLVLSQLSIATAIINVIASMSIISDYFV